MYKTTETIQDITMVVLLVFTPLARGATPRWAFCITAILAIIAFTAMLARRLGNGQGPLPRTPLDLALAALLAVLAATLVVSVYRPATYWALGRFLLYAAVFYLAYEAARYRDRARWLMWTIVAMAVVLCLIGLAKYLGAPVPVFWKYFPGQETFVTGTYMNHNHLAGYLEMSLGLGAGLLLFKSTGNRWVLFWLVVLMFFTLFWTMSRGGWIGACVGLALLTVMFGRKTEVRRVYIRLGLATLVVVSAVVLLGSDPLFERAMSMDDPREPSWSARVQVWEKSLTLISQRPLLGTGLGTFPWTFTEVRPEGLTMRYREAHNDYVQLVTEAGLVVLLPLLWAVGIVLRRGWVRLKQTESNLMSGLTAGALAGIAAIMVHSISDFNVQLTANGVLLAVLTALAVGPDQWKRSNSRGRAAVPIEYKGFGVLKESRQ